jgi:HSP20 family protein
MDRLFEQMRRSMRSSMTNRADEFGFGSGFDLPRLDRRTDGSDSGSNLTVERDGDDYVVLADLPGFEKEELDLRFDDGTLTIRGRHEVSESAEGATTTRSRSVFDRVRIPGDVHEDDITATYRNGVLEVRLPAVDAHDDDSRRIDVD